VDLVWCGAEESTVVDRGAERRCSVCRVAHAGPVRPRPVVADPAAGR
jgi:hypothetical protein